LASITPTATRFKEHVIRFAAGQGELAHGHAAAGGQVQVAAILHRPTGEVELVVDELSGAFFWTRQWRAALAGLAMGRWP
jgi:hypothetical protein